MMITEGSYLMEYGIGEGLVETAKYLSSFILTEGSTYDMNNKNLWHRVCPLSTVYSVMYTGKPWNRPMPVVEIPPQRPLTDDEKWELLRKFRDRFRMT
jgi:hypothetical protein